ncbi:MAG: hypothetical protein AAFU41_09765 [Pseudomonadota bacterium]
MGVYPKFVQLPLFALLWCFEKSRLLFVLICCPLSMLAIFCTLVVVFAAMIFWQPHWLVKASLFALLVLIVPVFFLSSALAAQAFFEWFTGQGMTVFAGPAKLAAALASVFSPKPAEDPQRLR